MTRPTGEDEMSEMTDERAAEVLAAHNGWRRYNGETGVPGAPEMGDPAELGHAIDHAVSRLRSQPPAEAQPVAHYCEHRHKCKWHADGAWPSFGTGEGREQAWKDAHAERCGGRILPLYAHPPPSAPVGVEAVERELHRVYMDHADNRLTTTLLRDMAEAVVALAQQPAAFRSDGNSEADFIADDAIACTACGGSGHRDDQQPAAVDDLNTWRAAFIAERATRYREGGMAIEQARIHAETDAACIDADALAAQQPAAVDGAMVEEANEQAAIAAYEKFMGVSADDPAYGPDLSQWMAGWNAALAAQPGGSDNDR